MAFDINFFPPSSKRAEYDHSVPLIVAFQGELGAYSSLAIEEVYPQATPLPCATFEEALACVEEKKAHLTMLPVENSQWGRVADLHHLLPNSQLTIIGEHFLRIRHQLLGVKGASLSALKTVRSHPQALGQCRQTLQALGITPIVFEDTAGAARWVEQQQDPTQGAIASVSAAKRYNLDILKENIEDVSHNTTRFLIMSEGKAPLPDASTPTLMSFVFETRNIPAALYKALGGFATNGVNITKLESYQLEGHFFATRFYLDIEGHPESLSVQNAFEELSFFSQDLRILGVYPASSSRPKPIEV
jgi:prephenate dehydratase